MQRTYHVKIILDINFRCFVVGGLTLAPLGSG